MPFAYHSLPASVSVEWNGSDHNCDCLFVRIRKTETGLPFLGSSYFCDYFTFASHMYFATRLFLHALRQVTTSVV